ncbi:hypothetical protein RND71_006951 [Anisodus tanguticus]|uniref:F-box associated beta-propeller type 3 domain-containing protein n=1 Tax=Anisodus tanguticus TaxID=243964 RepID=A0AAE1SSX4_9SOLA|nr:hypothetical protein RND71_006951 [Anisodus tanguticus]
MVDAIILQPNKKRKRSLLREHTKEEGNAGNSNESNKLSDDVVSSIFIRCTVNMLSMLKCASKSWNDYISSPFFVHSHLEHSTENAQVLFVKPSSPKLPRLRRHKLQFVSVDMEGKGESNKLYTVAVPEFISSRTGMFVSSGLVCLSSGYEHIYVCNPVMQQLCKLPKCSSGNFGFGYHHSTKEYKVVQFFYTCPAGNKP